MELSDFDKQERIFLDFINFHLLESDRQIGDITDLSTGVDLYYLLQSIFKKNGRKEFPIFYRLETKRIEMNIVQKVNVDSILQYLQNVEKIRLFGINTSSIVSKDKKSILALIWRILIHNFQEEKVDSCQQQNPNLENDVSLSSFYNSMVDFVNENVADKTLKIETLEDWKTGKSFFSLFETASFGSSMINQNDYDNFLSTNRDLQGPELISNCIDFARIHLSVPVLITENDFTKNPSRLEIALYMSIIKHSFSLMKAKNDDNNSVSTVPPPTPPPPCFDDDDDESDGMPWILEENLNDITSLDFYTEARRKKKSFLSFFLSCRC